MKLAIWQELGLGRRRILVVALAIVGAPLGWALAGVPGAVAVGLLALAAALRVSRHGPFARLAAARAGKALALRKEFVDDLATALGRDDGARMGVLVVRLDGAPELSRMLGNLAFEELIHRIGHRLLEATRISGGVARLDSAEWGVLLAPAPGQDATALARIAERLQAAVAAPLSVAALTLRPSVSVGICDAAASRGTGCADALVNAAATAAETALAQGPGAVRHADDLSAAARSASSGAGAADIRSALDSGAIHAVFQPQICARTGAVAGAEALVRWTRGDTVVPPDAFLPALHRLGLSEQLTRRMLGQALDALARVDAAGVSLPEIAINLSAEELRCDTLADTVIWDLEARGIAPSRLVVEILESVVADQHEAVMIRNVEALAKAGCAVDLDDFGTGHASIANIRRFAVDRLKIDRSFIRDIDTDREQQRLVCAILSMAQELSLGTVAEGVETDAEAAMLRDLGCPVLQGYGFARPMAIDALVDWLSARSGSTVHVLPRAGEGALSHSDRKHR